LFSIRIDQDTLDISITEAEAGGTNPKYLLHGLVLYVVWGAFLTLQICSARYLKQFWMVNMWVHGIFGSVTGILTVYSCAILLKGMGSIKTSGHKGFGYWFTILSVLMIFGGLFDKVIIEKLKWKTFFIRTVARVHKYLALLIVLYGQFVILTGIKLYYKKYNGTSDKEGLTFILFFLHLTGHVLIFAVLEIVFRLWRNKSGALTSKDPVKTITSFEYEGLVKEGKQLCVLDDLVLDVGRYASRHPGGKFLIDATVGRDVSKYFYGGYKMENSKSNRDSPYRHSMMARKVVSTIVYARLNEKA